jgi:hypothetical protein
MKLLMNFKGKFYSYEANSCLAIQENPTFKINYCVHKRYSASLNLSK